MPACITVDLRTLSGDTHQIRLSMAATCGDLRWAAQGRFNVSRRRIIICHGCDILEDTTPLIDIVGWCVIPDIIDPCVFFELEVQMDMLTISKPCEVCNRDAQLK